MLDPAGSTEPRRMPRLPPPRSGHAAAPLRPGSPSDCDRLFLLSGPGPLTQTCLGPSLGPGTGRAEGAESTGCAAAPAVKHLCFAQGVHVPIST